MWTQECARKRVLYKKHGGRCITTHHKSGRSDTSHHTTPHHTTHVHPSVHPRHHLCVAAVVHVCDGCTAPRPHTQPGLLDKGHIHYDGTHHSSHKYAATASTEHREMHTHTLTPLRNTHTSMQHTKINTERRQTIGQAGRRVMKKATLPHRRTERPTGRQVVCVESAHVRVYHATCTPPYQSCTHAHTRPSEKGIHSRNARHTPMVFPLCLLPSVGRGPCTALTATKRLTPPTVINRQQGRADFVPFSFYAECDVFPNLPPMLRGDVRRHAPQMAMGSMREGTPQTE